MLPANPRSWFARLTQRRRPGRRHQEPADMGTAFGMEQWLDECDEVLAARPHAHAPARTARSWLRRWLQAASVR